MTNQSTCQKKRSHQKMNYDLPKEGVQPDIEEVMQDFMYGRDRKKNESDEV